MSSLTVTRTLAAPRDRVWTALTSTQLAGWLWPSTWNTRAGVDLRVGGAYSIGSDVAQLTVSGNYVEVRPVSRVVQTWRWDGEEQETLVTITLDPTDDGGTDLMIVHERFHSPEERENHVQGWIDCLERLPWYLA